MGGATEAEVETETEAEMEMETEAEMEMETEAEMETEGPIRATGIVRLGAYGWERRPFGP